MIRPDEFPNEPAHHSGRDCRRQQRHGRRIAAIAAAVAAVVAAAPAVAQDNVGWRLMGEFGSWDGPLVPLGPLSSSGADPEFSASGDVWTVDFNTALQADTGSPPTLKSKATLKLDLRETWSDARFIGYGVSDLRDTVTVTAQPGFSGGILRFNWGMDGQMKAGLTGDRDFLGFFSYEYLQLAQLYATGSSFLPTTIASETQQRITSPNGPPADAIDPFVKLEYLSGGFWVNEPDKGTIETTKTVQDPGGGLTLNVPIEPGTAVDFSVHLLAGIALSMNNVDYYGVKVDHDVDLGSTATLNSVELLDANGVPYTGAWSLASANGIPYPVAAVPEPSTSLLALAGIAVVGGVVSARRRRDRRSG